MFIASLLGGWLFPWWWPSLAGFVLGFILPKRTSGAFFTGFFGTALAWVTAAAYLDWQNHHLLTGRIAILFHLPSATAVLAATALLGGIFGGLGAWAGFAWGRYLKPRFKFYQ
jgi:hypothetical protein